MFVTMPAQFNLVSPCSVNRDYWTNLNHAELTLLELSWFSLVGFYSVNANLGLAHVLMIFSSQNGMVKRGDHISDTVVGREQCAGSNWQTPEDPGGCLQGLRVILYMKVYSVLFWSVGKKTRTAYKQLCWSMVNMSVPRDTPRLHC